MRASCNEGHHRSGVPGPRTSHQLGNRPYRREKVRPCRRRAQRGRKNREEVVGTQAAWRRGGGMEEPWPVSEAEDIFDPALRAANLALSGRKRREVSRIASIELRFTDARSGAWEALAMVSVGVAT